MQHIIVTRTYESCTWIDATHFDWRGEIYPKALHSPEIGGSDCILPLRAVSL